MTLLFRIEACLWSAASVGSAFLFATTIAADFPARSRSLVWLAALFAIAAALAIAAAVRAKRERGWLEPPSAAPRFGAAARSALRIALLLPWAFVVLVAAAGFSA